MSVEIILWKCVLWYIYTFPLCWNDFVLGFPTEMNEKFQLHLFPTSVFFWRGGGEQFYKFETNLWAVLKWNIVRNVEWHLQKSGNLAYKKVVKKWPATSCSAVVFHLKSSMHNKRHNNHNHLPTSTPICNQYNYIFVVFTSNDDNQDCVFLMTILRFVIYLNRNDGLNLMINLWSAQITILHYQLFIIITRFMSKIALKLIIWEQYQHIWFITNWCTWISK